MVLLGALIFGLLPSAGSVFAAESAEEEQCIKVCFSTDNHTNGIGGAEFSVCRIAGPGTEDGGYTLIEPLEEFGPEFRQKLASGDHDLAEETLQKLRENGAGKEESSAAVLSETTDEDGTAVFGPLEDGIYLVWENEAKEEAAGYRSAEPVLASVPSDGGANTEETGTVLVYPKTGPVRETEETTPDPQISKPAPTAEAQPEAKTAGRTESEPAAGKKSEIVKTGDSSGIFAVSALAAASAAAAWLLLRKKKKEVSL